MEGVCVTAAAADFRSGLLFWVPHPPDSDRGFFRRTYCGSSFFAAEVSWWCAYISRHCQRRKIIRSELPLDIERKIRRGQHPPPGLVPHQ